MSTHLPILPGDPDDARLVASVHPPGRSNPVPADRYGLVVIGGGPAGLVAAFGAAGLGARVAIVERGLLGGDCLNVGCVPSKALLASAHAVHAVRSAGRLGVRVSGPVEVDGAAVLRRMRSLRADIAPHDSVERLEKAGIDVFLGEARFTGRDTVSVGGATLRFTRAVLATGARAALPPIPGLADAAPLTNESIFSLAALPARLVVLGAGPIGVELGQAFARLGVHVTLIDKAPGVLPREDREAAARVQASLQADGVDLRLGASVARVARRGTEVEVEVDGEVVRADHVLVALGRSPNVDGLDLEAAGILASPRGVQVDDHLRTTNPRVFAAGDVIGSYAFTHTADAMARIVLQNALFAPSKRVSALVVPWVTYTDPELAHVGPAASTLTGRTDLQVLTVPFADLDRAVTDDLTDGFARVWADRRGQIVAATIVGAGAGELIAELVLARTHGLGLAAIGATLHPYPTRSEVVRRLGDAWNRTRLTPAVAGWMRRWLSVWGLR